MGRDGESNGLEKVFPPPPHPLMDSHGGQCFLVELILNHGDDVGSRKSYLVHWLGISIISWDSLKPRSQLMMNVYGIVKKYDETHPLMVEVHRRTNARRFPKGISSLNPFEHLVRDSRPSVGLIRE